MSTHNRRTISSTRRPSESAAGGPRKSLSSSRPMGFAGERTVKSLRLSKALTVPETTTVYEACRRMAARRVDALLLTDSNALLCGILTDKDIATKVVAREINPEETPVSKVMTRNPVFVLSETLAVEALQKMVLGKFRHLPVVENGEVLALLDIAKCLYDAIARMERAAEKGKAIAAAVEGVEKHWGSSNSDSNSSFIEAIREQIFKPSLSTIIPENSKTVTVLPTDSILKTTKKMVELHASCAVVTVDGKPLGILTSRDILMRVIGQNLLPASTPVEKVMTPNPECAVIDTAIVDALHTMHDGKFLHLPVVDRDGIVVAVVDVIHVTHAAVATVSQVGNNEAATSLMQRFWDSAMTLPPTDDDDENRRGDEEYLYVDGMGIKTGDIFRFYHSDPSFALASLTEVRDALNKMKLERNSRSSEGDGDKATNVFGGLIFACYGRGESFFERPNADSSPFLENFPGVPLGGIFCGGEMVRPCTTKIGLCPDEKPISCFLHVYSTVYLMMSYDPPSVEY